MSKKKDFETTLKAKKKSSYLEFLETPLKVVACWDLFQKNSSITFIIINKVYFVFVLFTLSYIIFALAQNIYVEWNGIMSNLDKMSEFLPLVVSLGIIAYYAIYRNNLYELVDYMNENFKYHSARGLTNLTMYQSCQAARRFWIIYTACTLFSVTMYTTMPVVVHLWTKEPMQSWLLKDITKTSAFEFLFMFLVSCLSQLYVGLALGQFGIFFAANSILICGQLDLLCCSLRNAKYTALLQNGVKYTAISAAHADIQSDEKHTYSYNIAEMKESPYHYDEMAQNVENKTTQFDIYSAKYDASTMDALRDCAALSRVVKQYIHLFEDFVSPLLVLRVVQVTLYLCTLLYTATLQFEVTTVEYLAAVALDLFVYCYYGNQIIIQANRVSLAAYQTGWNTMGVRPRRVLLHISLSNKRLMAIRAGKFLALDLRTFVNIIKTSFSYYTLLVNVNEK